MSSKIQLGSKLPADIPFRVVEYAVTLVLYDGLSGYISKVICQCSRLCLNSVFARVTKLKGKNMVCSSLMSWVCHVDCTLYTVNRTSVPKAYYRPAAEKEW